jgi:Putative Actinobacterial Holin-X, holin superfamily III
MSRSLVLVVGGALIAYGGVLAMVAAMILGLVAAGLAPWASALVGGALAAGIGYLLVRLGLVALRRQDWKPRQAIAALKEDAQWVKSQTR